MTSGIQLLYGVWAATGTVIAVLFGRACLRALGKGEIGERFFFSLGIFLSWFGGAVITRGWWLAWRGGLDSGVEVGWMTDHWVVSFGAMLVVTGGVLHIRTATVHRWGERFWLGWVGLCAVATAVAAAFA